MEWLDFIRDLLFRLTPFLPRIVGFLIVISFILIGALLFILKKTRARAKAAEAGEDAQQRSARGMEGDPDYEPFSAEPDDLPLLPLRKSFKHALKILRNHVAGRDWRYAIPWYLLLGPEQSGKSTLVSHTGMDLPVGHPADDYEDLRPACKWWFFDRGVVLDMAGSLVRQRDGRGSNVRAWKAFLGYLDRYRPRRPADGIILTIPIEDLLDSDGAIRPPEDIAQRADSIYKKLWQAQARLGLAFPVYLVVTKMDRLPGFKALVQELPDHALADMLGWSSPYSFETEFRETWIDEVIETVGSGLQSVQMEIFATSGEVGTAEEIYSLPASFEGLREPLRIYLRQVFKPSVYHDSFSLRGVWFTGDSGLEEVAPDRPIPALAGIYGGPTAKSAYPVFLSDLFETKVFPEKNIARPIKRALLSRNKLATGAQMAAASVVVIGGLLLWYLDREMHREVVSVTPFIDQVTDDMRKTKSANRSGASSGSFDRESALVLLEGMAALETGSFFSYFIPSSWVADVDNRVIDVTTDAFSIYILQSLGAALDERGQSISSGRLPPEGTEGTVFGTGSVTETLAAAVAGSSAAKVERGAEFDLLQRYVVVMRDFETAVERYNSLSDTQELEDIRRLVHYLFSVQLPESFLEDSNFYSEALSGSRSRPIPLQAYSREIQARYDGYLAPVIAQLYDQNPMMVALRNLGMALDQAANRRSAGLAELQQVHDQIERVKTMLANPRYAWMDDPTFDPTIAYGGLIERIAGSSLLGDQKAQEFTAASIDRIALLRTEMPELRALSIGPLLDREGDQAVLRLSPAIEEFYTVLLSLYQEPFMRSGRLSPMPSQPAVGVLAGWDANVLNEGVDLIESYETFFRDELDRVPRALHSLMRTAAGENLEMTVNDRIAAALITPRSRAGGTAQAEDSLRRTVAGFDSASGVLTQILASYDTLGLEDSYLDLLDLSIALSFAMIEEADKLFEAGGFYAPQGGNFRWWDGSSGLALRAFRVRDVSSLRDSLTLQRERIASITTNYVSPVMAFLGLHDIRLSDREASLRAKWRRIEEEMIKYNGQQVDSTLLQLEQFITGPMLDINFSTCSVALSAEELQRRSSDFFLDRINRLARGIQGRCQELAGTAAQSSYSAIADLFEDTLAGRFPFTLTPFEDDMREVSPRDLRRFFATYDREVPNAREALEQAEDLGFGRDQALAFITQMDRVRAVFDPWLSSKTGEDSPVFSLQTTFRVNRPREVGGDQVIDWRLSSGSDVISQRSEDKSLRWGLGEPVELRLRWADNSTVVPATSGDRTDMSIVGRTISIAYDNIWSLMDMIRRNRAGSDDFVEFVDPRPHTLRINVPTRPEAGGSIQPARLYLRIELSAQNDGQPVPVVLTDFPFEAPRLDP